VSAPVCYLIHLDQRLGSSHPNGSAGHYLGTTMDLARWPRCRAAVEAAQELPTTLPAL
jgi:hypothetical protein